jgi:hypothetical protein
MNNVLTQYGSYCLCEPYHGVRTDNSSREMNHICACMNYLLQIDCETDYERENELSKHGPQTMWRSTRGIAEMDNCWAHLNREYHQDKDEKGFKDEQREPRYQLWFGPSKPELAWISVQAHLS